MADEYLSIDLDALRVREIEEIEEIVGKPFDEVFAAGIPKGIALRAIGFIIKKRDNPNFTLEEAGELIIKLDKAPPTEAAG